MGKTSNNSRGMGVSSRQAQRRPKKVVAALGSSKDVCDCLARSQASRFKTFPGEGLKKVEQLIHEEMIKPGSDGGLSSISGEMLEEIIAANLRHGQWIEGAGKWDGLYSRGPSSIIDTLVEIKAAFNLKGRTPVNIRNIGENEIIRPEKGETADNINHQEVGRRLLAFERHKMEENLKAIIEDTGLTELENAHSELIIVHGENNGRLRITIEPYMPTEEVADQFIWLRDPDSGNFMAVMEKDYRQLHPDNIPELKSKRVLEWQIGRSNGNLRYLPENLPGREILENYTISMPQKPAPSAEHYYFYRSEIGLSQLIEDIKFDTVKNPGENITLSTKGQRTRKQSQRLNGKNSAARRKKITSSGKHSKTVALGKKKK